MNNRKVWRIVLPTEQISSAIKHCSTPVNFLHEMLVFGARPETLMWVKSKLLWISVSFSLLSIICCKHKSFCGLQFFNRAYISLNLLWEKRKVPKPQPTNLVRKKYGVGLEEVMNKMWYIYIRTHPQIFYQREPIFKHISTYRKEMWLYTHLCKNKLESLSWFERPQKLPNPRKCLKLRSFSELQQKSFPLL
jgi:hypothetical protein